MAQRIPKRGRLRRSGRVSRCRARPRFAHPRIRHRAPSALVDMSTHRWIDSLPSSRPVLARYGVAVACTLAGWFGRDLLTPVLGTTALPYVFFFPAIAIAAWYGGLGPAILCTALSLAAAMWFFIAPLHTLAVVPPADVVSIIAFLGAAFLLVGATETMHRTRRRLLAELDRRGVVERELARGKDLLATTLSSIGDGVIVTDRDARVTFLNPEAER